MSPLFVICLIIISLNDEYSQNPHNKLTLLTHNIFILITYVGNNYAIVAINSNIRINID